MRRDFNLLYLILVGIFVLLLPGGYYLIHNVMLDQPVRQRLAPLLVTVEFSNVHNAVRAVVKQGDDIRDYRDNLIGLVEKVILKESEMLLLKMKVLVEPKKGRGYMFLDSQASKPGGSLNMETERYIICSGTIRDVQVLEGIEWAAILTESVNRSPYFRT